MALKRHPFHVGDNAKPNHKRRMRDDAPNLLGFDVETNHLTGEPKLMQTSDGEKIIRPIHDLIEKRARLIKWIRRAIIDGVTLVSWRQFDHLALLRILIEPESIEYQWRVIEKHGRINPCVELEINGYKVTLSNFKNSITIGVNLLDATREKRLTVVDASKFYYGALTSVCESSGVPYQKGAKELHLIDWDRYALEEDFRSQVDASNLLDAQVALRLQQMVHENINTAFNVHAPILSSAGSACKTALASVTDETDYQSINWFTTSKTWDAPQELINDLWCMAHESYSGGLIDTYRLGYEKEAHIADIASAYPAVITQLPDLRGAEIVRGIGAPNYHPNMRDLTFIRGTVDAPITAYHTLSYANSNGSKARVAGINKMTYTHHEREWAESQGVRFTEEEFITIRTRGIISPLGEACQRFLDDRVRHKGTPIERVVKEAANSLYGTGFEMIEQHSEIDGNIEPTSLRPGELYNPVYASLITALSRMRLSMACSAITRYGGHPIAVMTDSVSWAGGIECLPVDMQACGIATGIREAKTTGYFETPERITDYLSLGTGRYEYFRPEKSKWMTKARGYRFPEGTPNGPKLRNAIHEATRKNPFCDRFQLTTGFLVGPGFIRNRRLTLSPRDLCRVIDEDKDFKPFSQGMKRRVTVKPSLSDLLKRAIQTYPQTIQGHDNTLPELREDFKRRNELEEHEKRERASQRHKRHNAKRRVARHFARFERKGEGQ